MAAQLTITNSQEATIATIFSEIIYRVNTHFNYEKYIAYNKQGLKALNAKWSLWS